MPTTLQTSDLLGCEQEGVLMQESLAVAIPTTVVVSCPIADKGEQDQGKQEDNEDRVDDHQTGCRSDVKTTAPAAGKSSSIPRPKSTPKDTQRINSKSSSRPSRLAIPVSTARRAGQADRHSSQPQAQTTVNRLELENTFLLNHNSSLNRDIQHCRQTVQALKNILSQKEEVIEHMKHQYQQAHLKIKFMENILAGHHNFNHEMEQGPTSDDILEEDMFRLPEDEDEDEEDEEDESLVFLKSLAGRGYFKGESTEDSIESEDEQDSADGEDEEESVEEDHPWDHGPNYDKERVLYSYPDDFESEGVVMESDSKDHDMIDTHMDQSHEAPSINLYQQPNSPYHPIPMNNSRESAHRVQVIRRRPHRQLGPAMNDPALQPMSAEFTCIDSSSEVELTTDTDDSDMAKERPIKRVTLRDSGHFQSDVEAQDQHCAVYRSLTAFPEDEAGQEEPLDGPIAECEEADSYTDPTAIVPSEDLLQHEEQPQSDSPSHVGLGPRTFSWILLTNVQVETDSASTGSSSSHDMDLYDHQAGNRKGRSESLAKVVSDDKNISKSGSKDTVQAEDWSSSSMTTILSGTTDTVHSNGFEKDLSKGVRKIGSVRSRKAEATGSPLPLVLRLSSKVRRSRLLGKTMSKSPLQGHQEVVPVGSKSSGAGATTTVLSMSDTDTPVPLAPAALPTTAVEPLDTEASVAATTTACATPPDSARKSTIWSRMKSGLGLSKGTKSDKISHPAIGSIEVPGQPAVRAEKSTGIWKLRPRSRLRPKPTAVPASAMVDTDPVHI